MRDTSRERFLQQLERCVRYQNEHIMLPDPPRSSEMLRDSTEFIAPEEMGNGAPAAEVETQSVWGLRPPNEPTPPASAYIGDWA